MKAAGYRDPLLVATTDGVGTKLKIAIDMGRHDTIGIDLVAMCVNDLVVQGAEPLLFLDYYASGKLDLAAGTAIVAGIAAACREAGCALVGGETAELPGLYAEGDYDLAGFALGAVERDRLLPREDIAAGDVVLGLASSGVHSNGFSLVRRIVEAEGLNYRRPAPFAPELLGDILLTPTRLYVKSCLEAARADRIKAFAHITGGGLYENLPRVLPQGLGAVLDARTWPLPPVLAWIMRAGGVAEAEMARTFNCGIGMMAVVAEDKAEAAIVGLAASGEDARRIGHVVALKAGEPPIRIDHMEQAWRG